MHGTPCPGMGGVPPFAVVITGVTVVEGPHVGFLVVAGIVVGFPVGIAGVE